MFKIENTFGKYCVKVQKYTRFWCFFHRNVWVNYEFRDLTNPRTFNSYHQALQHLLVDIELELNLKYLNF